MTPKQLGFIVLEMPICKIHKVKLVCPACIGAAGGSARSEAKAEASRENGKLGGRRRKEAKQALKWKPIELSAQDNDWINAGMQARQELDEAMRVTPVMIGELRNRQ